MVEKNDCLRVDTHYLIAFELGIFLPGRLIVPKKDTQVPGFIENFPDPLALIWGSFGQFGGH